jgi:acetylornithine deacetylase/succinyl-diaminopimelate desuccinylase-like protein
MGLAQNFLINIFSELGLNKNLKGKVHGMVFAEKIIDSNLPTVLIYGHYDVQPPDSLNEWVTDPFDPVVRNGNLFARGTSDDKGQIMANILAVKTNREIWQKAIL